MSKLTATQKAQRKARRLWVKALRSGEYKQGYGYLHYKRGGKDKFCCLGVLCDLAVKNGVIEPPVKSEYSKAF